MSPAESLLWVERVDLADGRRASHGSGIMARGMELQDDGAG
jgi:hypothetical protein